MVVMPAYNVFPYEKPREAPEMSKAELRGKGTKRMVSFFLLTLGFPPDTSGISGARTLFAA